MLPLSRARPSDGISKDGPVCAWRLGYCYAEHHQEMGNAIQISTEAAAVQGRLTPIRINPEIYRCAMEVASQLVDGLRSVCASVCGR
jgi:hypothetical protein